MLEFPERFKDGSGQATFTIKVAANVASGTRLNNTAGITADQALPDSDDAAVEVANVPILLLAKSADRTAAAVGDTVTFTVSYRNSGNGLLTGVTVADTLPAGLEATAASDGGTISTDGTTVTWALADIAAGEEGILTVDVTVTQTLTDEVSAADEATTEQIQNAEQAHKEYIRASKEYLAIAFKKKFLER